MRPGLAHIQEGWSDWNHKRESLTPWGLETGGQFSGEGVGVCLKTTLPGLIEPMSSLASQTILSSVLVLLAHITTPPSTHTHTPSPGLQVTRPRQIAPVLLPADLASGLGALGKSRNGGTTRPPGWFEVSG